MLYIVHWGISNDNLNCGFLTKLPTLSLFYLVTFTKAFFILSYEFGEELKIVKKYVLFPQSCFYFFKGYKLLLFVNFWK